MSSSRIIYSPRPDATPEAEVNALAAVYKLILDSKKAAPESRPGALLYSSDLDEKEEGR